MTLFLISIFHPLFCSGFLVHKDAFEPGGFCLYCTLKLGERFRNYEDFVEKLGRVRGKEAGREKEEAV